MLIYVIFSRIVNLKQVGIGVQIILHAEKAGKF